MSTTPKIKPIVDPESAKEAALMDPLVAYKAGYLDAVASVGDATAKFITNVRIFSKLTDAQILKVVVLGLQEYSDDTNVKDISKKLDAILKGT